MHHVFQNPFEANNNKDVSFKCIVCCTLVIQNRVTAFPTYAVSESFISTVSLSGGETKSSEKKSKCHISILNITT